MKLAEICGQLNADMVADQISTDQLFEWWAFGYLQGWFPVQEESKGMDPHAAKEFFQRLGNG